MSTTRIIFLVIYLLIIVGMMIPTVMTLLPNQNASKLNRLGYRSTCTFTPWSTLSMVGITLLLVGIVYAIQYFVTR